MAPLPPSPPNAYKLRKFRKQLGSLKPAISRRKGPSAIAKQTGGFEAPAATNKPQRIKRLPQGKRANLPYISRRKRPSSGPIRKLY